MTDAPSCFPISHFFSPRPFLGVLCSFRFSVREKHTHTHYCLYLVRIHESPVLRVISPFLSLSCPLSSSIEQFLCNRSRGRGRGAGTPWFLLIPPMTVRESGNELEGGRRAADQALLDAGGFSSAFVRPGLG